jgi:transcriptional regulator with XRE-family HTH domain
MSDKKKLLSLLGKRIRAARDKQGLTQEKLAELCECDPTYISLLERGKRNPAFLTLANLAANLSVRISDLVKGIK